MIRRACCSLTCLLICELQFDMTETGASISVAAHASCAPRPSALSAIIREMVWIVLPNPISSARIPPDANDGLATEKFVAKFV